MAKPTAEAVEHEEEIERRAQRPDGELEACLLGSGRRGGPVIGLEPLELPEAAEQEQRAAVRGDVEPGGLVVAMQSETRSAVATAYVLKANKDAGRRLISRSMGFSKSQLVCEMDGRCRSSLA